MDLLNLIGLQEKGDAEVFAELFKDKLVFDHSEGVWYIFNGTIWERDTCKHTYNLVEQVAQQYEREVESLGLARNEGIYRFYRARISSLRKRSGIKNVLELASAKLALRQKWDSNPYLLAVKNGVIDLKTGKLNSGNPEDYIRTASEIEYKGLEEPCQRFEQFLSEIFAKDNEVIAFIQRLFGYSITGLAVEHVLPIFYGEEGRNGKDTFLKTICSILGDNLAKPISKEILLSGMRNPGAAAPFLFELQGKRLVYADETSEGARFDEGQVKMLSGGAPFAAKKLYHQPVTIIPQYLLVMTTNSKPEVSADDPAIWERIILIEFSQRFIENPEFENENRVDKFLEYKLKEESSGILAWLVRGCLEWQKHSSLRIPESVKYTTQSYKDNQDTVGRFIQEECVIAADSREKSTKLYDRYSEWAKVDGAKKLNWREFSKALKQKGCERHRYGDGYHYEGITLKPTVEEELESYLELISVDKQK